MTSLYTDYSLDKYLLCTYCVHTSTVVLFFQGCNNCLTSSLIVTPSIQELTAFVPNLMSGTNLRTR